MKRFVLTFALISALTLTAQAEPRGGIRPSDFGTRTEYVPEIVEIKGVVKSKGTHQKGCGMDLELVEANTEKKFGLSEPGELAELHCVKEKDFLVSLKAERVPKFLFWGGGLKVLEFQVLEELESNPHLQASFVYQSSFEKGIMSKR